MDPRFTKGSSVHKRILSSQKDPRFTKVSLVHKMILASKKDPRLTKNHRTLPISDTLWLTFIYTNPQRESSSVYFWQVFVWSSVIIRPYTRSRDLFQHYRTPKPSFRISPQMKENFACFCGSKVCIVNAQLYTARRNFHQRNFIPALVGS